MMWLVYLYLVLVLPMMVLNYEPVLKIYWILRYDEERVKEKFGGKGSFSKRKKIKELLIDPFAKRLILPLLVIGVIAAITEPLFGWWIVKNKLLWWGLPILFLITAIAARRMRKDKDTRSGLIGSDTADDIQSSKLFKEKSAVLNLAIVLAVALLLFLSAYRPLLAYDKVNEEQDITGNIEDVEGMPDKVKSDEIRLIPWSIGSQYLERNYGDSASYLQTSEDVLKDDTSPTVVNESMYWVNIPRFETLKWTGKRKVPFYLKCDAQGSDISVEKDEKKLKVHKEKIDWGWRVQKYVRKTPNYQDYEIAQKRITIDEEKNPYVAIYLKKPHYPEKYDTLERVILVDAASGDLEYYDKPFDDVPEWMEVIYPDYYIYDWIEWWGAQRKGEIYNWFNKEGIYRPAASNPKFIVINETSYWYTPMIQAESNVLSGYVLTNTRTGESQFYQRDDYVDYDTIKTQLNSYLESGQIGFRQLTIREGYIYRVTDEKEMYIIPLYAGLTLQKIAVLDPHNYTDEPIIADSLDGAIAQVRGEEETMMRKETMDVEGIYMEDEKAHIYSNNSILNTTKDSLVRGNQSADDDWTNLKIAQSILYSGNEVTLRVMYMEEKMVDIYIQQEESR